MVFVGHEKEYLVGNDDDKVRKIDLDNCRDLSRETRSCPPVIGYMYRYQIIGS